MLTIVKPRWELYHPQDLQQLVPLVERCGRVCYRSEDQITEGSADKFVRMICRNHHESVLEHASITVKITCSRAASHQLVRHRVGCAYSQESMRYCNYWKKGLQVIAPIGLNIPPGVYHKSKLPWRGFYMSIPNDDRPWALGLGKEEQVWLRDVHRTYESYKRQLKKGSKPENARFILPTATKTEVVTTYNVRMWRHVFRERAFNKNAQWEIRGIFQDIFDHFVEDMPAFFEDLKS